MTSSATNNKDVSVGTLEATSAPIYSIKLTVLDNVSLSLASESTIGTVSPSDTVSLSYTGAQTGAGKYISCIIVSRGGSILYYGKLADATVSDGTASFTVPAGLGDGSYTVRLFNEQINDKNYTDYASTPVDISMTVDSTPPTITAISPAGAGVALTQTDLVLTFSKTVTKGTGSLAIQGGGSTYTANVSGATISGTGTSCTATIPLSAFSGLTLAPETTYTVGVAGDAFKDTTGLGIAASDDVGSFTTQGQVATPAANPSEGTYTIPQTVTLTCATEGASIYYTTNGDVPSSASGLKYTVPFSMPNGQTLKAIAIKDGMVDSAILSAQYTQGALPSITPTSGTFDKASPQSIAITLDPAGLTCAGLTSDDGDLVENTHYTKAGNVYTLLPAYMGAQTVAGHTVSFQMSGGVTISFALTVLDSTPDNITIDIALPVVASDGGSQTITVDGDNLNGKTITVELLDKDGNVVATQTVPVTGPGSLDVTLEIPPNTSTTEDAVYDVRVTVEGNPPIVKSFPNAITVRRIGGEVSTLDDPLPPEPEILTLTDNATGISVTGPMYGDTTLRVARRDVRHAAGCKACDLIRKLEKEGYVLALYDVELVPPVGGDHSYTVSFPVGTSHNGKTLSILHCDNGIPDWGEDIVRDGKVRIGVTSLSPFAVLKGEYDILIAGDVPKTGDGFPLALLGAAFAVLAAGAALLFLRRPGAKDKRS